MYIYLCILFFTSEPRKTRTSIESNGLKKIGHACIYCQRVINYATLPPPKQLFENLWHKVYGYEHHSTAKKILVTLYKILVGLLVIFG